MKASSPAARKLATAASVSTERKARVRPKYSASPGAIRPEGTARRRVRAISVSMSASHHMLSAPAAPAPIAIASSEAKPITGWSLPGAISIPASAVNTTSDMTRGLRSEKNSFGPAA